MGLTAFIKITNECNLNCFYCLDNQTNPASTDSSALTLDNYSQLFENMKNNGFTNIIITGGEPLTNPDIYEIIKLAAQNSLDSVLLTNTKLIDETIASNLKKSGLSAITVSLSKLIDSSSGDYNELLDYYESKICLLERHFDIITSTFLITAKNFSSIHQIYKQFGLTEKRAVIYQPLYLNKTDEDNYNKYSLTKISDDDWKEIKNQLADWMIKHNTYSYIQLIHDNIKQIKHNRLSCFMGSDSIVIDVNGNVYPCFHRKDLYAGNILKHKFKDILINTIHKSNALVDAQCISDKCLSLFLSYV